jgi:hypothetical protein
LPAEDLAAEDLAAAGAGLSADDLAPAGVQSASADQQSVHGICFVIKNMVVSPSRTSFAYVIAKRAGSSVPAGADAVTGAVSLERAIRYGMAPRTGFFSFITILLKQGSVCVKLV